jgi:hypothetical protein
MTMTAPPMPLTAEITPAKRWYWIGSLAIAAGVIAGTVVAVSGIVTAVRQVDHFARIVVPGKAELSFAKAGKYTIYYEYRSVVDGQTFDTDKNIPTGLKVTITDAKGNAIDSLQRYDGDLSVSSSGIAGKAVFTFKLTEPGHYFFAAQTANAGQGKFVLSVGKGFAGRVLRALLFGGLLALVGLAIGLPVIIRTAVKRGREKRARQQLQGPPPGGWPQYQGWQGYVAPGPVTPPPTRPPTAPPTGSWAPPSGPPAG